MDLFQRILHDINERNAARESRGLPMPRSVRKVSTNEKNAVYTPPGTGLLYCPHGKPWIDTCSACKRTRKDAELQRIRFLKNYTNEHTSD